MYKRFTKLAALLALFLAVKRVFNWICFPRIKLYAKQTRRRFGLVTVAQLDRKWCEIHEFLWDDLSRHGVIGTWRDETIEKVLAQMRQDLSEEEPTSKLIGKIQDAAEAQGAQVRVR